MKWVNTKRWLIQPEAGYSFRVENDIYTCYFRIWHFALIKKSEITS